MTDYSIFGAGPGGLYTAWRLLSGGTLTSADSVTLYEWGDFNFPGITSGNRNPAGRICSYHYQGDSNNSYIEVGGMRYIEWDGTSGHKLVTATISALGLQHVSIPFNTTTNPLLYLRGQTFLQGDLGPDFQAPYATPGNNENPADDLYGNISKLLIGDQSLTTRAEQCNFYSSGTLPSDFNSFVYSGGETVSNIGYWNVFYDQAGNEGYNYATDAGGYSSNTINWNAADAAIYNGEFAPGGSFKTLSTGYSSMFSELFTTCQQVAQDNGIDFNYVPNTRLHSIWSNSDGQASFTTASSSTPEEAAGDPVTTDYAFLAMPPHSIELVAQATRYNEISGGIDFLNTQNVRNYLESVIEQPSYKVAMFFDSPWWENTPYPPCLVNEPNHNENVFGPTITDLPLRQIYYFGNNAPDSSGDPVYGLLASYDDMRFIRFWQEMELGVSERRTEAKSQDYQPLFDVGTAPESMEKMLLLELAKVHYGNPNGAHEIPAPLETRFMDWGLAPFGAGYHAWAPHYDICDVMQNIRIPAVMAGAENPNIFILGSAFSNDQAWVEGAFCTAESILTEFLGLSPLVSTDDYPLICPC